MPLTTTFAGASIRGLGWGAASGPAAPSSAMELLTPTSISNTSGTASIGTNGVVTYTSVLDVSLNGVFSATYDNYLLVINVKSAAADFLNCRWRAAGTDNTSTSSYVDQRIEINGTNEFGVRNTRNKGQIIEMGPSTNPNAISLYVYGPFLTQPTAARSVSNSSAGMGYSIFDYAFTHNASASYDGVTLFADSNAITGTVAVYGLGN